MVLNTDSTATLSAIINSGLVRAQKRALIEEMSSDTDFFQQENALCRSWFMQIKDESSQGYELQIKLHQQTLLIDVRHCDFLSQGLKSMPSCSHSGIFPEKNLIHMGVISGELLEVYAFDLRFVDVRELMARIQFLKAHLNKELVEQKLMKFKQVSGF